MPNLPEYCIVWTKDLIKNKGEAECLFGMRIETQEQLSQFAEENGYCEDDGIYQKRSAGRKFW